MALSRRWWAIGVALMACANGQEAHVDVLLDQLNYQVIGDKDLHRLSPAIASVMAQALGVSSEEVRNNAGLVSQVDLHPGTSHNEWMSGTWPLEKPGVGTLVSARVELPSTIAFIAESSLKGSQFESKMRKVAQEVLGADHEAIAGQIFVRAAMVSQDTAAAASPQLRGATRRSGPSEGTRLLLYSSLGVVLLLIIGMLLWCSRGLCTRRNASESKGFLQVGGYDEDIPIYQNRQWWGQGH